MAWNEWDDQAWLGEQVGGKGTQWERKREKEQSPHLTL